MRSQGDPGFFPCTGIREVQVISGTPSGPFTLTFGGHTTTAIPVTAAAADIQAALDALTPSPAVTVVGGPLGVGPFAITFGGAPADVAALTTDSPSLTVATLTPGVAASPPGASRSTRRCRSRT